jgi:glycogen synthase
LIRGWAEAIARRELPSGAELRLLGHARDGRYLTEIRQLIRRLGVGNSAHVEVDLPRGEITRAILDSAIMLHGALFEPFGLALLEGMAGGLVPLVRASEWSGAWTDILELGRWGKGFRDPASFVDAVASIFESREPLSAQAVARSSFFSEERFTAVYGV